MDRARQIAQAVLYECHPYHRLLDDRYLRGLHPEPYAGGRAGLSWMMQTQCLVEAAPAHTVDVHVRFLQLVSREVARARGGELEPAAELTVDGARYVSGLEAREREAAVSGLTLADLAAAAYTMRVDVPGDQEAVWLIDARGRAGAVLRCWETLHGQAVVRAEPLRDRLFRLTVKVANTTDWRGEDRAEVLRHTFVSAQSVVRTHGGRFVSLLNPPAELRPLAEGCRNIGTWPVLVGEVGERHTMLSAPIILRDHPRLSYAT
ncbi:hypothetical protein [Nonomuraea sp. C10]|uniref:hypothetical protein n=1 Tax=Nonomuraea sp. C10 TaxID=2600577 RepID=UPI0011CED0D3|nr:hypothetical protein [Nonomuraea sp. C10]TXK34519.1 hypothetical protein FR742_34775 [Nonomuraea sp. C10]